MTGILSNFRLYRRFCGGTWYEIEDRSTEWGGTWWTQDPPEDESNAVIRMEVY